MYYYEIRNRKTNEVYQAIGSSYSKVCLGKGWRPQDCKCVWKASTDNAEDPAQY